VLQEVEVL